jgi:molybdenum cofactor guanylyltransferase
MESIEGFVLVGGRSSRMGTDKSALILTGETLAMRAAKALGTICKQTRMVGGSAENLAGSFPRVPDVYPNWGALGGVHAALTASTFEWIAILACDLPFVTQNLFEQLARLRTSFDAVAAIQSDGIPQPLCALYRVNPCRERATCLIESGERRPIALLQSVRTRWVTFDEIAGLEGSSHFFDNINTPDDYARAAAEESQSLQT